MAKLYKGVETALLYRAQSVARSQTFNGRDRAATGLDCEREATVNATAIDQNRARAALAVVAPFLASGKVEILAKSIQQ